MCKLQTAGETPAATPRQRFRFFRTGNAVILSRMNLLPFGQLPSFAPRQFVPSEINLGDWNQIAPLFDRLESRAAECRSAEDLERWLIDWGELSAVLDEESSRRYIAMTCHTDN